MHLRVCAALLRGVVTGQSGDEDRAGELLSGVLVDTREAGLGEQEIVALTQLAQWHLRADRLPEARGYARDAVELAGRAELRLRCADAFNVFSRVERTAGDTEAAAQAAREAYLQAWCDGPPFSYAAGLDEARVNLSAVGAPEPSCPGFELGEPFPEVLIKPTAPRAGLSTNLGRSLSQSACAVSHELLHTAEAHTENGGGVAHTELVVMHEPPGGLSPSGGRLPRQLLRAGLLGAGTGGQRDSIGVDAGVVHHDDHCGGVHVEPEGDKPLGGIGSAGEGAGLPDDVQLGHLDDPLAAVAEYLHGVGAHRHHSFGMPASCLPILLTT